MGDRAGGCTCSAPGKEMSFDFARGQTIGGCRSHAPCRRSRRCALPPSKPGRLPDVQGLITHALKRAWRWGPWPRTVAFRGSAETITEPRGIRMAARPRFVVSRCRSARLLSHCRFKRAGAVIIGGDRHGNVRSSAVPSGVLGTATLAGGSGQDRGGGRLQGDGRAPQKRRRAQKGSGTGGEIR
jgi:hypothetical protein